MDIKWLFKTYLVKRRIKSFSELSRITGIKYQTLMIRLESWETVHLYELRALDKILDFSEEDLLRLIREVRNEKKSGKSRVIANRFDC